MGQNSPQVERVLWALLISLVAVTTAATAWGLYRNSAFDEPVGLAGQPVQPLSGVPVVGLGRIPDFELIGSGGSKVTRQQLDGQILVVDFFFTSCAGVCPVMSRRLSQLQGAVPEGAPVRFLSITVDPERDTPEVLTKYAAAFAARDDLWLFLTGAKQEIIALARDGFRLSAGPNPADHSSRLALVDRDGTILGYYDSRDESQMRGLRAELRKLLGK